jgi:hypothetical protein
MASKRKPRWTAKHLDALLEYICRRPRMFFEPTATVRDLAFFLQGTACGLAFPHHAVEGAEEDGFWDFAFRRRNCEPPKHGWKPNTIVTFLVEQFGDRPLFDACTEIADLFAEWRKLHPSGSSDTELSEYC